jgi:hypothetical protein
MMGSMKRQWNIFDASCVPSTHELAAEKTQDKIVRCRGMSKLWTRCATARGGGQVVFNKIGRTAHCTSSLSKHPLPELAFSFWGFIFESTGISLKKGNEADGKTANMIFWANLVLTLFS